MVSIPSTLGACSTKNLTLENLKSLKTPPLKVHVTNVTPFHLIHLICSLSR